MIFLLVIKKDVNFTLLILKTALFITFKKTWLHESVCVSVMQYVSVNVKLDRSASHFSCSFRSHGSLGAFVS